jgi:putative spermidine/putrescine transport system substrate-binding protein
VKRKRITTVTAVVATFAVLNACGSDEGGGSPVTGSPPTATTAPAPTAVPTSTSSSAPASTAPGGNTGGDQPDVPAALGKGEGELNLIAWAGYAEDGSSDPAVDWVTPFERETGCKVNVKLGNTSDEMVQLMQTGEYDGVSASGDATERLMDGGEVAPINPDLIPNYADIFDGLKLKVWNSKDGVPYGVPHGRGANLLAYNTEAFPTPPDSIKVMFEDGPASGKISVYDSPIYIADAAIYLMATKPELTITNPYALDQHQFDAAIKVLQAQKPRVGQYWALYSDQQAELESGNVLAGTTWQIIVNYAQGNGAKVEAVKQQEGATGWSDTWMVSSRAKHPNCMYMWMNHIISPEANAAVAEWFGEAPSNAKACAIVSDGFCELFHAADESYWNDVWYWTTATETCLDGRTDVSCVPYSKWVDAWTELRA